MLQIAQDAQNNKMDVIIEQLKRIQNPHLTASSYNFPGGYFPMRSMAKVQELEELICTDAAAKQRLVKYSHF